MKIIRYLPIPVLGLLFATIWNEDRKNFRITVYQVAVTLTAISLFIIYKPKEKGVMIDTSLMNIEERARFIDSITSK